MGFKKSPWVTCWERNWLTPPASQVFSPITLSRGHSVVETEAQALSFLRGAAPYHIWLLAPPGLDYSLLGSSWETGQPLHPHPWWITTQFQLWDSSLGHLLQEEMGSPGFSRAPSAGPATSRTPSSERLLESGPCWEGGGHKGPEVWELTVRALPGGGGLGAFKLGLSRRGQIGSQSCT